MKKIIIAALVCTIAYSAFAADSFKMRYNSQTGRGDWVLDAAGSGYLKNDTAVSWINANNTFVPYTGSNTDVNLGNHSVMAERGIFSGNGTNEVGPTNFTGNVAVSGNVSAQYYQGNGSQLTGLAGGGNANYEFAGNNFNGTGKFTTTGNVSAGYYSGNGSLLSGLPTYTNESTTVENTGTINLTLSGSKINATINATLKSNWDTAYGWGDHSTAGYLKNLTGLTTDNLTEGANNLYFTNERVDDRVAVLLQNGTGITWSYNDTANTLTPTVTITQYTDALARLAISVTGQGSYNSTTGVITINSTPLTPWASDVNASGFNLTNAGTIYANAFSSLGNSSGYIELKETGTSPTYITTLQSGDLNANVTQTLPTTTGTLLNNASIGSTIQAYSSVLAAIAGVSPSTGYIYYNGTGYSYAAGGSMTYPDAGIAVSTGSSWGTSLTDNHANWDAAYTHSQNDADTSATNEIEVQDETYNATNFNGDTTHAVSQDDFYDLMHLGDTDDDGLADKVDLAQAGFVKSSATGVLSVDTATYLTSTAIDTSSEIAAIVGDETGSGALVFGTSPVITLGLNSTVPSGASVTTDAAGEIGVRTGANMTGGLQIYGAASTFYPAQFQRTCTILNLTNATEASVPIWRFPIAVTVRAIHAVATVGAANVTLQEFDSNGANGAVVDSSYIAANATSQNDDGSLSNSAIDAGDWVGLKINNCTANTTLSVAWEGTYD